MIDFGELLDKTIRNYSFASEELLQTGSLAGS
jgi:hypothetical protein